jgi:subtilisin family serine protease
MMMILTITLVLAGLLATAVPADAARPRTRYVVVFNTKKIPAKAAKRIRAAGGKLVKRFPRVGVAIATSRDPRFAAALSAKGGVHSVGVERFFALPSTEAFVAADQPVPGADDGYFDYQWDIRRVNAHLAWDITTGSHDTVVAIIDTGIAWNHPDLAPNVVYTACFAIAPTCSPYPDLHWHGTHVAGTVAAAFGGGRAVGVGPDLGLASYNVFQQTKYGIVAYDEAIWAAMLDAAAQGFDVINLSLGSYIVRSASPGDVAVWTAWNRMTNYVSKQGVTIVASAGNEDRNLNGPVDHIPSDVSRIISVGATGIRPDPIYPRDRAYDVRASYSNYGAAVTLSAPGGDAGPGGTPWPFPGAYYLVFSDYVFVDPTCAETASCPVGYAWAGGTSMSAPHVAGAAGLINEIHPDMNPNRVASLLKATAERIGKRQKFGHGLLDAFAAVNR